MDQSPEMPRGLMSEPEDSRLITHAVNRVDGEALNRGVKAVSETCIVIAGRDGTHANERIAGQPLFYFGRKTWAYASLPVVFPLCYLVG